ncbi:MAG: tetratricopeptide repeat protein [Bdellovibrionales bacterium]|nr:tetratricopeptide repeat protein [Massilia sp.]
MLCPLLLIAGCSSAPQLPPMPPAHDLFADTAFAPPATPVAAENLFRLSAEMQAYLHSAQFSSHLRKAGPESGLVDALYKKGELKLEYDAAATRNAADTFASKKGNCLSLVIMTAAFAKELGLNMEFQNVLVDEQWSRANDMYFASTHVNLKFKVGQEQLRSYEPANRTLTVDFMRPADAENLRTRTIDEQQVVAMYMNNRAAEELVVNQVDAAYWWARAAIAKDPSYITAYNTLGVIYQRHGDYALAERVYKRALEREREDTIVMHNLIPVLTRLGKTAESIALAARLKTIQPTPPFFFFDKGMKAMEEARYAEAKALFEREVTRSPYYHEFHFWLAIAHWRLGNSRAARDQLALAVDTSTTARTTQIYSGKLDYLRSLSVGGRTMGY